MRRSSGISRFLTLTLLVLAVFLAHFETPAAVTGGRIGEDEAIARAMNNLTETADGYTLKHPRHRVEFTRQGISVASRRGGVDWRWHLSAIRLGDESLLPPGIAKAAPQKTSATQIDYRRGELVERYLTKGTSVEQQFIILAPLSLGGRDLIITGGVECEGTLRETEEGWEWRTGAAVARLGKVKVIDASGAELAAGMEVTATETRIEVNGEALAGAHYPVTIDPEIGANDFRISDMGPGGDANFDATDSAVAYNSTNNEYLVIWRGDDDTAPLVDGEVEIFGQRINAATGAEVGTNDFRISDLRSSGHSSPGAGIPAVAYNSTNNEYLVVFSGTYYTPQLNTVEREIFGQRLNAATGAEVGTNDFRISDMGPAGDGNFGAGNADIAYNSTNNEYLVVWNGIDDTPPLVAGEYEVFGQRINAATGAEVGPNDFRISDMGPDGDGNFGAGSPAVAYNSANNEYLVVWGGADNIAPLIAQEGEIFGQRINGSTGAEIGANDFRISDMGPDGDANFSIGSPAVAYNRTNNEYLVVWIGDDNTVPLVDNEFEVFGQRINAATGAEVGTNDFRISDMGPDGNASFGASFYTSVVWNSTNNEYLVVWIGDDNTVPLVDGEFEVFGQRLNAATGAEVGTNDFRISDTGPDGNANFSASAPAVAWNSTNNEYLVVWNGEDNTPPLVDNERENFGQRINAATGAEVGTNDFRISDMGSDGNANFAAALPAVAYNSTNNEYLVVWQGDDNKAPLVNDEVEIFGQRINAATGAQVGANDFRISDMGPDGNSSFQAFSPAVAWNSTNNEYLVVWRGDDNTAPLIDNENEIFGQRINAATGEQVGTNDFRISDLGPNGNANFNAFAPAVAYNGTNNEYLVVWNGDDNTAPLVDNENEIFGQRINAATGAEVGTNDFRISDLGPDGNISFNAFNPAVAWNSTNNEYLVVWRGDDNTAPLVDNENEIFGQRINAATGAEVGSNDFRISDMGPDSNASFDASEPAVAWNGTNNQYLVVWSGDDVTDGELEIYGQRINAATGAEAGTNDFRISDMGTNGNTGFQASEPDVAWNSTNNEYLVVWWGDDNTAPLIADEREIFGQRINAATGAEVGSNDFRISDMGSDGSVIFNALASAVAYNSTNDEYLVVWEGNDFTDGHEIWGQRLDGDGNRAPTLFLPGPLAASVGVPFNVMPIATDADAPAQTLTFSLTGAPAGMTINPMTGLISWIPAAAQTGLNNFTLRVTDDGTPANITSLPVSINVTAVRTATALRIIETTPMAGGTTLVTAQLTTFASNGGLADRTVTFTPGSVSGMTSSSGIVTVPITTSGDGPHVVTASFAGDAAYDRSFAKTSFSQIAGRSCSIALLKTSESFPATGGSDSVVVSTSHGDCPWVAGTNDPSIATIASGTPGNGAGALSYNVLANPNQTSRSGTLNIAGLTFTIAQGANFLDVPTDDVFYTFIGKLSARGVTTGCGNGNFCPNDPVTREQMAAFIMRALGEFNPPIPGSQRFIDVPPNNFFYAFIDRLAAVGITTGCNPPTNNQYCPGNNVIREQMAAFLMRALGEGSPPTPPTQRFLDVTSANFFYAFIEQLAVRRITLGCNAPSLTNYCPGDAVTRGQMAAFLVRAFGL